MTYEDFEPLITYNNLVVTAKKCAALGIDSSYTIMKQAMDELYYNRTEEVLGKYVSEMNIDTEYYSEHNDNSGVFMITINVGMTRRESLRNVDTVWTLRFKEDIVMFDSVIEDAIEDKRDISSKAITQKILEMTLEKEAFIDNITVSYSKDECDISFNEELGESRAAKVIDDIIEIVSNKMSYACSRKKTDKFMECVDDYEEYVSDTGNKYLLNLTI